MSTKSGDVRPVFIATSLVSAAAIGYEILLMRVLSIVQWHHFAYMIISLALLGYGASGTFIALFRKFLEPRFAAAYATSALLFAIAMVACFMLGQRVPFNALEIVWDPGQFIHISLIYLVFFVPFFFAACCIGLAFTCRPAQISRIYFSDLFGAGFGALLIVLMLFVLTPRNALLLLSAIAVSASALVGLRTTARRQLAVTQLGWILLISFGVPHDWLDLRMSEYKGLSEALQVMGSRALAAFSSPLGLLTVVESPSVPFRYAPGLSFNTRYVPPAQIGVFTDGDAMSVITRYDGDIKSHGYLGDMTAALAYQLTEQPNVLVLGAGAGSDVLLAIYHGARHIDAVELNPQMSRLVRETYADFAGHLYDDPRITLFTAEARGFVMQSDTRYDLIHIGLLDSFGASGAGVQALHESYLYTVEALENYYAHLAPGGILAITRWLKLPPRDSLKLFATAIASLRNAGSPAPGQQLAMIRSWNTSTLLVKNGAYTGDDISVIREFSRSRSFDTVYYPSMPADEANRFNLLDQAYLHDGALALLGDGAPDFLDRYKFYVEPATDDQPYFFHFFKWSVLPEVFALRTRGGAGLIEWGYLILVATVAQATIAGFVLILVPLSSIRRSWPAGTGARMGGYFFLLGLAFLFVEIAFIQKFVLFLSHPLYSVAVVLSGFLVFAGLGSACSGRVECSLRPARLSPIMVAVSGVAFIAAAYVLLLPAIFAALIGLADAFRIAVSLALIAPLAFFMGMPFPLGLRRTAENAPDFIPWAWGINGFASVVSAALATLLAVEFGFSAVIFIALLLYAAAAIIVRDCRPAA